jgi:glycosyltransferase involved in cell wall biosynthesis
VTIALDATPLAVPTGGVTRYTLELSRALAAAFPADRYWLVSDQPFAAPAPVPPNLACGTGPQSAAERRWWLWGLDREMRRIGAELFHGTDFSVPYVPRIPSVMTLHDLSPWPSPGIEAAWQPSASRIRHRTPWLLRLGRAAMVITPSEAVRRAAIARFHLAADRVVAVPLAASAHLRPVAAPAPERPYFLFVGTLEPRKNIARLIEAWREVRRKHAVDLVLAGRARADFKAPEAEPGLRLLGAVAEEQLAPLYSGALACVYPSLYEGFGLPVLEAMQCGVLAITSRDPAIGEIAEGAAVQVEATDTRALAEAMEAVAASPENFATLRASGERRAADYSWERTAQLTREVYEAAGRHFRS